MLLHLIFVMESQGYDEVGGPNEGDTFDRFTLDDVKAALARLRGEATVREPDFWRCRTCGCLWRDNHNGSVSLASQKQTSCVECEGSTPKTCEPLFKSAAVRVDE